MVCSDCFDNAESESDDDVRLLFEIEEARALLLETGLASPLINLKLTQKDDLKAALIEYNCLIKPKASMDQFVEGLGITHQLIKCFPSLCKTLCLIRHLSQQVRCEFLRAVLRLVNVNV